MLNSDLIKSWPKEKSFLELTRQLEDAEIEPFSIERDDIALTLHASGVLEITPIILESNHLSIDLVISCGVHGNETAPIELVEQLVSEIIDEKLAVKNRVLFIIGNPMAINEGERFVEENMNRLFCGAHQDKTHREAKRAGLIEQSVANFFQSSNRMVERRHYDLHTAIRASKYEQFAVYPYSGEKPWSKEHIAFFGASGINTILLGHKPANTFSYFSRSKFDAHGFTVELGRVKPFGQNDMTKLILIKKNLSALISGNAVDSKPFNNDDYQLFEVKAELIKRSNEFQLNIDDSLANFSDFKQGFQLTNDIDGGYQVSIDGEAIVFPNSKVPIGQRAGLVVARTKI